MKNKIIRYSIIAVIAVLFVGLSIYAYKTQRTKSDGMVIIELIDREDNVVSNKKHPFAKGDSLFDILDGNYTIVCPNSTYGHYLEKIDSLKSDNDYYLSLLVNDEYSNVGMDGIELIDGMKITIKEQKI